MGCVSSKPSRTSFCLHLPCLKACTSSPNQQSYHENADDDLDSRHVVSLTSSSYGLLNTERTPPQGSFLSLQAKPNRYQLIFSDNSFMCSPGLDAKHLVACAQMVPLKDKHEEDSLLLSTNAMETINTWELMDGLEDGCRKVQVSYASHGIKKLRLLNKTRSLDFVPTHSTSDVAHASCEFQHGQHASDVGIADSGSPVWKKYYMQQDMVKESPHFCHSSAQRAAPSSPFDKSSRRAHSCDPFPDLQRKQPSCNSFAEPEDSKSTSSMGDNIDESSSGLKLLLGPVNSSSYYLSPLTKRGRFRVTSLSFDSKTERLHIKSFDRCHGSPGAKKRWSRQQSMESSKSSDTQLFDPTLMATFERALEETSQCPSDEWLQQSMDENTTNSSSSENTWPLSEMASDAESGSHSHKQEKPSCDPLTSSPKREEENAAIPPNGYEVRCPPQGINKVVLYYTSLRGVRKTYEDCCAVRLILKGLGVHVEERDVWMHSQYKEELRHVLGDSLKGVPLVPQLFIKGRYIGGAEEVKKLHEDAKLARLLDGIAMDRFSEVCDGCGDVRFVPCLNCNGSCKVHNQQNEVLRCPVCNENGLIMCPICTVQ